MARVANFGAETQSATNGVEALWSGAGATLEGTIVRTGLQSLKVTSTTGTRQGIILAWRTAAGTGPYYVRFPIYIGTTPTGDNTIGVFSSGTAISSAVTTNIILTSTRTLKLQYVNGSSAFVDVGSPSSALNTGQWYEIFMKFDNTGGAGAGIVEAKIDGNAAFASASNATFLGNVQAFRCGTNMSAGADTTGVVYFDDITINDSAAGTGQTDYPTLGEKLAFARPTGAGDNAAEVGTASSINEVPVTDTSTGSSDRIELQTTTSIGDYNMTDTATLSIGATDTITMVAPLARVAGATSTATNYTTRIKSAASGTVNASSSQAVSTATLSTMPSSNVAFINLHIAHTDPTTSSAWTPTGTNSIDNMQIGVATTDGNPDVYCTWLGAYVGYVPNNTPVPGPQTLNNYQFIKVGDGMSVSEKIK